MADLITLSEYRTYDDAPSPAENDTQITNAIDLATSYIEEKTGRVFELADNPSPIDAVETLDGNGTARLYTRNGPLVAVTLLEYWDGTAWQTYDSITYPSTFKTGSNIIYFTLGHKFYKGYQNIRTTFTYGYTTSFPKDLQLACYQLAKYIIQEAGQQGLTRQEDGEQNFWYDHAMPAQALEIIKRYKQVW